MLLMRIVSSFFFEVCFSFVFPPWLTKCPPCAAGDMSVEAFTCLLVFKNIFSFGLTVRGFDWIVQGGIKPVFVAIASVQVGICVLSVPMCEFFCLLCLGDASDDCSVLWCLFPSPKFLLTLTPRKKDILGKKNRSFFHRHNVFFKATDALANPVVRLWDRLLGVGVG
jgi:hypothetical protein